MEATVPQDGDDVLVASHEEAKRRARQPVLAPRGLHGGQSVGSFHAVDVELRQVKVIHR